MRNYVWKVLTHPSSLSIWVTGNCHHCAAKIPCYMYILFRPSSFSGHTPPGQVMKSKIYLVVTGDNGWMNWYLVSIDHIFTFKIQHNTTRIQTHNGYTWSNYLFSETLLCPEGKLICTVRTSSNQNWTWTCSSVLSSAISLNWTFSSVLGSGKWLFEPNWTELFHHYAWHPTTGTISKNYWRSPP